MPSKSKTNTDTLPKRGKREPVCTKLKLGEVLSDKIKLNGKIITETIRRDSGFNYYQYIHLGGKLISFSEAAYKRFFKVDNIPSWDEKKVVGGGKTVSISTGPNKVKLEANDKTMEVIVQVANSQGDMDSVVVSEAVLTTLELGYYGVCIRLSAEKKRLDAEEKRLKGEGAEMKRLAKKLQELEAKIQTLEKRVSDLEANKSLIYKVPKTGGPRKLKIVQRRSGRKMLYRKRYTR